MSKGWRDVEFNFVFVQGMELVSSLVWAKESASPRDELFRNVKIA